MQFLISSIKSGSFLIAMFLFLANISSFDASQYETCGNVFSCGVLTGVDYPFYGGDRPRECGYPGFKLDCDDDIATIKIMSVKYRVLSIHQESQTISIAREDLTEDICQDDNFISSKLDSRLFEYSSNNYLNVTILYGCPGTEGEVSDRFYCDVDGTSNSNAYIVRGVQAPGNCHASVMVPVRNESFQGIADFLGVLAQGFEIRSKVDNAVCNECKNSNGRCGFNRSSKEFMCLCEDETSTSSTCLKLRDANQEERFQVPTDAASDTWDDVDSESESESKSGE